MKVRDRNEKEWRKNQPPCSPHVFCGRQVESNDGCVFFQRERRLWWSHARAAVCFRRLADALQTLSSYKTFVILLYTFECLLPKLSASVCLRNSCCREAGTTPCTADVFKNDQPKQDILGTLRVSQTGGAN